MPSQFYLIGVGLILLLAGCTTTSSPLPGPDSDLIETQTEENITPPPVLGEENTPTETLYPDEISPEDAFTPPTTYSAPDPNEKPVLYNLGVNFGPWNPQTNKAGDFLFKKGLFDDKIFLESAAYVVGSNGPKLIPELTFHLPEGTKIVSPVKGTVVSVQKMYSDDYAVNFQTIPNSIWLVTFEHLENVTVTVGQSVEVGTIVGEASSFGGGEGMAFTELVVWKGGATEKDILKLCPVPLLDSSVRPELEEQLSQLAEDWEKYMGKNIYDEDEWFAPGCMREQLTEYEALHPEIEG